MAYKPATGDEQRPLDGKSSESEHTLKVIGVSTHSSPISLSGVSLYPWSSSSINTTTFPNTTSLKPTH